MTASVSEYHEPCPRCGKPLRDVWGLAEEKVRDSSYDPYNGMRFETKLVLKTVNSTSCVSCGFVRVESTTNTSEILGRLIKEGNGRGG